MLIPTQQLPIWLSQIISVSDIKLVEYVPHIEHMEQTCILH